MVSRRAAAAGGLALVLVTALLTWRIVTAFPGGLSGPRGEGAAVAAVASGLRVIERRSLVPPNPQRLAAAVLEAAVSSLRDPHSSYLGPAAYAALRGAAAGRYSGVGIAVVQDAAGYPVVDRVVAGSPAALAAPRGAPPGRAPGLRPGDRLLSVNGRSIVGTDGATVRALLAGPAGTEVTLRILRPARARPAAAEQLTFTMVRRVLTVSALTWRALPGGVGDIAIAAFNARTPLEMASAVRALRARHVTGMVIDLRDDPGGLVSAAEQVARYLLPGGVVAYLQPRSGVRVPLPVPRPLLPLGVPYVVLVNGYSASAAELLAAAVQDDRAAPLVGERTFGKGSVQQIFPLPGGGALKLTVAHYITPGGRDVDAVGVRPDVEVAFPRATPARLGHLATDPQLAAAVALLARKAAA